MGVQNAHRPEHVPALISLFTPTLRLRSDKDRPLPHDAARRHRRQHRSRTALQKTADPRTLQGPHHIQEPDRLPNLTHPVPRISTPHPQPARPLTEPSTLDTSDIRGAANVQLAATAA